MKIIFIAGGARSGKSDFALRKAKELSANCCFLATAEPSDAEMVERINLHKIKRDSSWHTIEEPINILDAILSNKMSYNVILVDCLTLWLSNLLLSYRFFTAAHFTEFFENFISSIGKLKSQNITLEYLIFVTNEVGMGIVPDNELSRHFRDMSGTMNNYIASAADEAYFLLSGIPLKLK